MRQELQKREFTLGTLRKLYAHHFQTKQASTTSEMSSGKTGSADNLIQSDIDTISNGKLFSSASVPLLNHSPYILSETQSASTYSTQEIFHTHDEK